MGANHGCRWPSARDGETDRRQLADAKWSTGLRDCNRHVKKILEELDECDTKKMPASLFPGKRWPF
jgi:hypothetical protein